ncbi:MAG: hypothetical protein ACHRXM_06025 [Isosphaerales bacterium]
MTLDAKNYVGRVRDPKWERDLARELRLLPEAMRLQFVKDLLDVHLVVALDLARKCLSQRESLESLLEFGLQEANPSTMQDWLKCVLPGLGARRLVRCLHGHLNDYPQAVESARYWLPGLLTKADRSKVDLKGLKRLQPA